MTTVLGLLGVVAVFGLLIWAAMRSARQAVAAEEQAKEAQHAVDNAERIAAARDAAPADADALIDRLSKGGRL